ncbi:diguanylate cyclase [Saccharibacillus sp. CPCC 101409]|uniref:sensor domain-containing diguanylate cyclase n=1 Tax=Saccharibacillus sp. CPCC 101409 TaxID=3058041 RepID=UPI002670E380|nr:diguanylate cyclase [Saccharibacillus sp. CPCC 101409]MDO3410388.1 diguanylate cyclase [Saccharibacillus sp. CPCC 101409]
MDIQLDYAPGGYFSISENGFVQSANRTFLDMLGLNDPEALIGQHIESAMSPTNKMFFHTYFYPYIQLYGRVDEMYFSFRTPDKQNVPVLLNGVRQERGGEIAIDCVALLMRKRLEYEKDTLRTKRKLEELYQATRELNGQLESLHVEYEKKQRALIEVNQKLETLALTDALTGLSNRRAFQERLHAEFASLRAGGAVCSLLLVDIDHFKKINDTYGHPAGDLVLADLARLLRETAEEGDLPARFGGEEFVLLLPGSGREESIRKAESVRTAIEVRDWGPYRVTVSVGAATADTDSTESSLLYAADLALYASKSGGRNRTTHADD